MTQMAVVCQPALIVAIFPGEVGLDSGDRTHMTHPKPHKRSQASGFPSRLLAQLASVAGGKEK